MSTNYKGIDYASGTNTNRDTATGIRYGVISQDDVGQSWFDSAEADYGSPTCPKCGNEAVQGEGKSEQLENGVAVWTEHTPAREDYPNYRKHGCGEYACDGCRIRFDGEDAYGDSPSGFTYEQDGYAAQCGEDGDIFIVKSPFFTYAQFCSPCAPGACHLGNPLEDPNPEEDSGNRAYCFGHDWFEDGVAPYPVYSVETGELVQPDTK
jgi:hypothetical protein